MHHGEGKGCQNGNAVKIYAAAGPYTTSQDLDYQPLMDLLGTIEAETPDVVILMGPFVDMRQDKVQSGEELTVEYEDGTKRHVCFEQFFAAKIASELENMYESNPGLKTQFVLVPSMDDAIAEPV
jgi:DNA polymerase alpha subunit B